VSRDDRFVTIFLTNYHVNQVENIIMSLHFKNALEGKAKMTVYRIDGNMNWDGDRLKLIPTESRTTYLHNDFWFSLLVPANSVVMITFDYDVN